MGHFRIDRMSGAVLIGVDEPSTLSRTAALDALEDLQRDKAAAEARELRLLARIDELDEAEHPGLRWNRESVSTILRCAPVTARGRLGQARQLVDTLPLTVAALAAGRITPMHARVLAETTAVLDAATTDRLEARVLCKAETSSVSEFRAYCAKAVLAIDPAGAEGRHERAKQDRAIRFRPAADGMGDIYARVTADEMARVKQHLGSCADTIVSADPTDDRSLDTVRTDVFCDLLTGNTDSTGAVGAARGERTIQVTLAFSTLLNLDDLPGEIDGEPVAASLARKLANDPNAWWRPVLIDRDGHLEAVGALQYRPSAPLARMVKLHDRRCQFPGCRRQAMRCEVDHAVAFDHDDVKSGGLTIFENLHCLCKRHHRLKHEAGWSITRKDGRTSWRSPVGRRYEKFFDPYLDPVEPDPAEPESTEQGNQADDLPPF